MKRALLMLAGMCGGLAGCNPLVQLTNPSPIVARGVESDESPPVRPALLPPVHSRPSAPELRLVVPSSETPTAAPGQHSPAAVRPDEPDPFPKGVAKPQGTPDRLPDMPAQPLTTQTPAMGPVHNASTDSQPAPTSVDPASIPNEATKPMWQENPPELPAPPVPPTGSETPPSHDLPEVPVPAASDIQPLPVVPYFDPAAKRSVQKPVQGEMLPPPTPRPSPQATSTRAVPITLDAVLRLAQDQNGQVALAREKLNEAFASRAVAEKSWLPDLYIGPAYYRHEGGIQDFDGNLVRSSFGSLFAGLELRGKLDLRDVVFAKVDAERKIWQQQAEVAKLSSETLLDATNTYVDLVAARSGEVIGRALEQKLRLLLQQAQNRAAIDKGALVEANRVNAEVWAQMQINRKLRESASAAAARLIYLLGLDPASELVVLDRQMVMFDLVDVNVRPEVLVERAVTFGPGIREMSGLLGLIDDAMAKSQGLGQYLPTLELRVAEGAFGAGPNSHSNWDNRFDLALQARWNLTDLFTGPERRSVAYAKYHQAQIGYQDLQAKLIMAVQEAREAIVSGREQIYQARSQLWHADAGYKLSNYRLIESIKGSSPTEVLFAIKSVASAQFDLIRAIREYDKAQLRLFVVTGMTDAQCVRLPGR